MINQRKQLLRFIITWVITISVFTIIFSKIRFSEVKNLLAQIEVRFLAGAIFFSFIAHTCFSPARYKKILELLGCNIPFFETLILRMGSAPIKGILPFKIGESVMVAYLHKRHDFSYARGISSVILVYSFSFFALISFISVGWFFYKLELYQKIYFAVIFLVFFFIIILFRNSILINFIKNSRKMSPRPREIFKVLIEKFSIKSLVTLFIYSLGFEGCKLINAFFLFKAFSIEIPIEAFLIFTPIVLLLASLPITFGGLGTRESAILVFFSEYAVPDRLLGSGLLLSFVNVICPILFGLFFIKPFLNRLVNPNRYVRT
ncbi:MAG: flippase-like domain-containing protein [Candidatus Omnitrophica bacterium]|nr:flippase-like domain-containing protein [Candidatus Omnitrophota bacterium]MBU1852720.1 flippase-like domain-containing protein [Candidatus Omnitrophota bacterium]